MKIVRESDLGESLDELSLGRSGKRRRGVGPLRTAVARRDVAPSIANHLVYLGGPNPWDAVAHMEAHLGLGPCPICLGGPLRPGAYCLGCDRCGLDSPTRSYPGLPVGKYPNADYVPINQPKYEPKAGLKGGRRYGRASAGR